MNFKRYVEASDTWVDSHYIKGTDTDTITTLPAIIYPLAQTATIGLKGNTVQNGTPTPQNPIMPQGTGERTGNLYNINAKDVTNGYVNSAQLNQDGTMEAWNLSEVTEYIELTPNETYRLSNIGSYNSLAYCIYDSDKQYITGEQYRGQTVKAINMPSNGKYLRFSHVKSRTDTMLNLGSTALPYEPYGYKIPISSANTTTPVYLGEVETTRKITKLVLTGEENTWAQSGSASNTFYFNVSGYLRQRINITICSHYTSQTNISGAAEMRDGNVSFYVNVGQPWEYFYVRDSNFATVADFKSYLAQQYANGTPVTIWYVLATPTTGIVNEPLMKLGDYADSISGISIPTTAGANTLDVQTTLKPSEVTANYSGWHPVLAVHERDNGAWD